ncbi:MULTISPECIES: hypothetical protein [unclassified Neorhizobium]|uniref:hypothetical protein n=1 Tax=unclassified Neorhizobium TaxID=2629175 RepID=UPI001FF5EB10|nr:MULTISPECIES: hypothetical protein [unclassified Neorhizobium]MCJ9672394.1 hypothetical protein [Neorhizobium sp. SHOUNA12B]MCJ9742949.1 hypothetical protein [Neorhizobium sp. SHOUNA12A]
MENSLLLIPQPPGMAIVPRELPYRLVEPVLVGSVPGAGAGAGFCAVSLVAGGVGACAVLSDVPVK